MLQPGAEDPMQESCCWCGCIGCDGVGNHPEDLQKQNHAEKVHRTEPTEAERQF